MAKKKFVKLGDKANSFSDPQSGVRLTPGKVIELVGKQHLVKKIANALKGGHLSMATEEEYDEYQESLQNEKAADVKNMEVVTEEEDDRNEPYTETELNKMKKEKLVEILQKIEADKEDDDESKLSESEVASLTKPQLVEEILDSQEDDEEEDDEE